MVPFVSAVTAMTLCAALIRERRRRISAERLGSATLETLLNAVDANDPETGAHVRRVAACALALGEASRLENRQCRSIERVALFHDIGKIHEALFDILHEHDTLTPEERREIATHPERGSEVLKPLEAFYPDLREGVLAHHERWDGTGYPRGLAGENIPVVARVVALADTFDAIVQGRRYNEAQSEAAAVEVIRAGRGTQFDPKLTDLFLLPPVLADISRARRSVQEPHAHGGGRTRRTGRKAPAAPDLTFRWRTLMQPLRSQDAEPAH